MKEKIENVKRFVNDHKKEILFGAGIVVIGGAIFMVTKKKPKFVSASGFDAIGDIGRNIKLNIPENLSPMVEEISGPGEWYDLWIQTVKLSDLGKFGEELSKLDGLSLDSEIRGGVTCLIPDSEKA